MGAMIDRSRVAPVKRVGMSAESRGASLVCKSLKISLLPFVVGIIRFIHFFGLVDFREFVLFILVRSGIFFQSAQLFTILAIDSRALGTESPFANDLFVVLGIGAHSKYDEFAKTCVHPVVSRLKTFVDCLLCAVETQGLLARHHVLHTVRAA